jgi:hypothetical protein
MYLAKKSMSSFICNLLQLLKKITDKTTMQFFYYDRAQSIQSITYSVKSKFDNDFVWVTIDPSTPSSNATQVIESTIKCKRDVLTGKEKKVLVIIGEWASMEGHLKAVMKKCMGSDSMVVAWPQDQHRLLRSSLRPPTSLKIDTLLMCDVGDSKQNPPSCPLDMAVACFFRQKETPFQDAWSLVEADHTKIEGSVHAFYLQSVESIEEACECAEMLSAGDCFSFANDSRHIGSAYCLMRCSFISAQTAKSMLSASRSTLHSMVGVLAGVKKKRSRHFIECLNVMRNAKKTSCRV